MSKSLEPDAVVFDVGDEFNIPLSEHVDDVTAAFDPGQPRDSHGRWASTGVGDASFLRITNTLKNAYDAGYVIDDDFSGGQVAVAVDLLTLSDGQRAVRKKLSDFYGMTAQTQIDREVLAAKVANAIGISDVTAQQVSTDEVLLAFIDGKTGIRTAYDVHGVKIADQLELSGAREIGLLDWLIGNMDRKSSNWIVTPDQRVLPIDHGHAWDSIGTNSPFAKRYITGYESQSGELAGPTATEYTSTELATVRAQLNTVRDEFVKAEHVREFDELTQRLTELEAVAV